MKRRLYDKLWKLGRCTGCHQLPERSFFWKGRQFPICARCTGVLLGQYISVPLFFIVKPPSILLIILCSLMFLDWFLQYLEIRESNNIRRLLTGILGGYAITTVAFISLSLVFKNIF